MARLEAVAMARAQRLQLADVDLVERRQDGRLALGLHETPGDRAPQLAHRHARHVLVGRRRDPLRLGRRRRRGRRDARARRGLARGGGHTLRLRAITVRARPSALALGGTCRLVLTR